MQISKRPLNKYSPIHLKIKRYGLKDCTLATRTARKLQIKKTFNEGRIPLIVKSYTSQQGCSCINIYKKDDFSFPIVYFPFHDGYLPLAPSYIAYISKLVRLSVFALKFLP